MKTTRTNAVKGWQLFLRCWVLLLLLSGLAHAGTVTYVYCHRPRCGRRLQRHPLRGHRGSAAMRTRNQHHPLLHVIVGLMLLLAGSLAQAGTVHYYYTDPQGTPLAKTDASGTIIASYDYTPYGTAVTSMSGAPDGPGYTGHVNDPDTGLVYMQQRYYDPVVGRFSSVDPVGPTPADVSSFNRYAYASNNPVVNMDPDGRMPLDGSSDDLGHWRNKTFWQDDRCAVCVQVNASGIETTNLSQVNVTANAPSAGAEIGGAIGFVASLPVDFFEDVFTGGAGVLANPATTAGMTAGGAALGAGTQIDLTKAFTPHGAGRANEGKSDAIET